MLLRHFFLPFIFVFALIAHCNGQNVVSQEQAVLTNSDVVQMVKMGFSEAIISAKIKSSKSSFLTSTTDLAELKVNGVSEAILVAMIEAGRPPTIVNTVSTNQRNEAARQAIKALRRIASATDVGISYVNYSPLLAEVKTEVEDALQGIPNGSLKDAARSSLNEFEYAGLVWQATWRTDFVEGQLKEVAVSKYGIKKRGLLKVVWRNDFIMAIWRQGKNYFEVANAIDSNDMSKPGNTSSPELSLIGAWKLAVDNNGQKIEFDMTVVRSGESLIATLRSPFGNSAGTQISITGNVFSLSFSEQQKKKIITAYLTGTIEETGVTGKMSLSDGETSKLLPFSGRKLSS